MFCMKCGTQLPDNTAVCPKCGTKLSGPAVKRSAKAPGAQECSEKNQLMIRVPGKGLYFIADGNRLCFLNEATMEAEVVVKKENAVNLCGLGYSGGFVYYWHECQDGTSPLRGIRLYEMNTDTRANEVVWESDEEFFYHYRLDDNPLKARAILYNGSYYLLNYEEQQLMRVDLPSGDWVNLPLPDLKKRLPLYDWMKPRGVVDFTRSAPNYGMKFTGLAILGGYVYLSLDDAALFTLRYPLGHPEQVAYLPKNAATAIQNGKMGGMLAQLGAKVFSCPGTALDTNELCLYEIKSDGNLLRMISNSTGEISLQNRGGLWWRLGNTYYIGQIAIDLYERKWHKLNPLLFDKKEHWLNVFGEVLDFVPGPNNSVYLLTERSLYRVPQDWESQVKFATDIPQFRLLRLKDLK